MRYVSLLVLLLALFGCSDDESTVGPVVSDTVYIENSDTVIVHDTIKSSETLGEKVNYMDSLLNQYGSLHAFNTESVSFGSMYKRSNNLHEIALKDDGVSLSSAWRYWWYTPLYVNENSVDTIIISNRGWSTFYVPVYSYDQKSWHYFDESKVSIISGNRVQIINSFTKKEVWVARFYPYTLKNLNSYISKIISDKLVKVDIIGMSEHDNPINRITITNFSVADSNKKVVFLHARTHPAETGQSFVLEGLIDTLLLSYREKLDSTIFVVIPLYNVDGVNEGNTRTNGNIVNLEQDWKMVSGDSLNILETSQSETKALRNAFVTYSPKNIKVALNLHCSNSDKDKEGFFFYHFGDDSLLYGEKELSLYQKMRSFGSIMDSNYVYPITAATSGAGFITASYPESWWWANYKDSVMAMTFETTYSKAGMDHWINEGDMKNIGHSLAKTIFDYLRL